MSAIAPMPISSRMRAVMDVKSGRKKRYPEGYLFLEQRLAYAPRQEPGRYFLSTVVPVPPQTQPFTPLPKSVATAAAVLPTIGVSVTTFVLTVELMPVMVAVMTPFVSVPRPLTYFEFTPSQPQLFAPGGVPPVW